MQKLAWAVVVAVSFAHAAAHAASGTCAADGDCAGLQKCRVAESICVFEAVDTQSLIDAITAANADAARDVIFVGPNANGTVDDPQTVIGLDTSVVEPAGFGPQSLPTITTP